METFFQLTTSPHFLRGFIIFLIFLAGIFIAWLFIKLICKRKVCAYCGTPTRNKDDKKIICCDDCRSKQLLETARREEKILNCPDCTTKMNKRLIQGTDIVVDSCPQCDKITLDKEKIDELSFEPITFYEEKEEKNTEI